MAVELRRSPGAYEHPGGLVVTLPWPDPPMLANHRYKHWAQKSAAVRQVRAAVGLLAKRHPMPGRVEVGIVWHVADRRRRDPDGPFPTLKAAIDGLRDAGVLPEDDHTVVARTWSRISVGDGRGVDIVVEGLE